MAFEIRDNGLKSKEQQLLLIYYSFLNILIEIIQYIKVQLW